MLAAATGAFVNPEPRYVQSTGFVLDPSGAVIVSVYSSGAIGRLVAEDVVGLIRYIKEQSGGLAAAQGPVRSNWAAALVEDGMRVASAPTRRSPTCCMRLPPAS